VADKDNFFEIVLVKIIDDRTNGFVQADRLRVSGSVPFMVGVCALWPAELIKLATGSSSFPVCHAPWTITYLLMAAFLSISMVTGFPSAPR